MKPERPTRRHYRGRRLTATELAARLRALNVLASGKMRPVLGISGAGLPRE